MRAAPPRTLYAPADLRTCGRVAAITAVAVLLSAATPRLQSTAADIRAAYTKTEQMIPMRDGVKLFTIIYAPKDASVPCPCMRHRTAERWTPCGTDACL